MFASLMPDLLGVLVYDPFEVMGLAERFGFEGVDLRMDRAASFLAGDRGERFLGELGERGLRPGYCSLTVGRVSVAEEEWRASVGRLPELARLARSVGYTRAATVVLPGSDELEFGENEALHVRRVREVMGVLEDFGIRLGLEYVSPKTRRDGFRHPYIHDLKGALDLIGKIDRPGVGLMLDTFHWYCAGETEADLEGLSNSQVVVVHVNDAIAEREVIKQVVTERELPGESGVIDLDTFFSALRGIGYDGPVTCEPTNEKWGGMGMEEVVGGTAKAVKGYLG